MSKLDCLAVYILFEETGLVSAAILSYPRRGGGGTPCNGIHGEVLPERGTLFGLEVFKRVGTSRVEV